MAKSTVTGMAWDHNQAEIPAELQPELWFRPLGTSYANGLLTKREVKASLNADGSFTVALESAPGLLYVPFMRWLADRSQANLEPQNRALQYCEWKAFSPGKGGDISDLPGLVPFAGVYFGLGDPPAELRERDDVLYMDISGSPSGGVEWWGPAGARVGGA